MSSRLISFDTETTGLVKTESGGFEVGDHRVIEIGCVEIIGREKTGKEFQTYINPEGRLISEGAKKVTNISDDELKEAPKFKDVVDEFINFINGAEVVAHNANFDIDFTNNELKRIKYKILDIRDICNVVDSFAVAKKVFPGQRNSLDHLAERLDVTGYDRTYHGALLDAQILADTYLKLTGGQVAFDLAENTNNLDSKENESNKNNLKFTKFSSTSIDETEHNKFLEMMTKRNEKEANG